MTAALVRLHVLDAAPRVQSGVASAFMSAELLRRAAGSRASGQASVSGEG
jgi:hypothetical protein